MGTQEPQGGTPAVGGAAMPALAQGSAPATPGVAPSPATSAPEPQKCQVHHSYIWLGSIRTALALIAAVAVASLSSIVGAIFEGGLASGDTFTATVIVLATCGGALLVIASIVVYQLVSYKHLYFTLGAGEFNLYSGIFNKKRVHVPYQRVQSVDQKASFLQRLFGVCTVSIDTAGGSSNKAVTVPYLTKQQAEWLRVELFTRKRAAAMASAAGSAGVAAGANAASAASAMRAAGAVNAANPMGGAAAAAGMVAATGAASAAPAAANAGTFPAPSAPLTTPAPTPNPAPTGNVLDAGAAIWQDVGGLFAGQDLYTGRVSYEYGLTNKELVLTGLSSNTAFALVLFGLLGIVAQFADLAFDLFPRTMDSTLENFAAQATGAAAVSFFATIAVAVAGAMALLWLLSGVGACISYGGFRARRRDNRIEVERGLLQHTFQGVDIDRVQAVVVKQTFIRRLMGYCEVSLSKIDAAAGSDDGSQQSSLNTRGVVIHPFVKMSRVPEILAGIIPEYADVPTEPVPVAPVALRRALIRRCLWQGGGFWLAVCVAAAQLLVNAFVTPADVVLAFDLGEVPPTPEGLAAANGVFTAFNTVAVVLYVLAAVLLVLDAVGAVLWFRESSFAYNRRFMQISTGGFSRETVSFPRQKIQFAYTRTNPFQRMARTATIGARTAAGVGGTTMRLVDVREEDARAWLAWAEPRGNVLQ